MIGGATRVFALLGDPVAHSLSPVMHNAAFRALGLDATYVCLRCETDHVLPLMAALAAAGGGGNVTAPHKQTAASLIYRQAAGAPPTINTFWGRDGALAGDDTDSVGIVSAWRKLGSPPGTWLIVGTGGAALATARAAVHVGAAVVIRSRTPERRRAFEQRIADFGARIASGDPALVINCTPVGLLASDPHPIALEELPVQAAVLDLVYGRQTTPWVRAARDAGRRATDGRDVLLAQGLESFRRWFPETDPPVEVMHAALRGVVG